MSRLLFEGVDQMDPKKNIDEVISWVVKETGSLTDGRWSVGRSCHLNMSGFSREEVAKVMAATKEFAGQRLLFQ